MLDYHLHLWPHDESSVWYRLDQIAAYCEAAAAEGVTELALTEHANRFRDVLDLYGAFWDRNPGDPTSRAIKDYFAFTSRNSLEEYVTLAQLAQDEGLPVKIGLEVDYVRDRMDVVSEYYAQFPFDVLIGSVHWLGTWTFDDIDDAVQMHEWTVRDVDQAWADYTVTFEELAASHAVDVMAHPDLIKVAGHWASHPEDYWDLMSHAAATADVSIECSSAGWFKPVGEQYPSGGMIDRLAARGVTFTTASDAHQLGRVAARAGDLAGILEARGVSELASYSRRRRVMVPLRAT
ncbi:MAG: PHP domain-containing protein [Acidobacteriota bacterium]|nr:PHP domain-containing protein [Acidobacteriota bacterium]